MFRHLYVGSGALFSIRDAPITAAQDEQDEILLISLHLFSYGLDGMTLRVTRSTGGSCLGAAATSTPS